MFCFGADSLKKATSSSKVISVVDKGWVKDCLEPWFGLVCSGLWWWTLKLSNWQNGPGGSCHLLLISGGFVMAASEGGVFFHPGTGLDPFDCSWLLCEVMGEAKEVVCFRFQPVQKVGLDFCSAFLALRIPCYPIVLRSCTFDFLAWPSLWPRPVCPVRILCCVVCLLNFMSWELNSHVIDLNTLEWRYVSCFKYAKGPESCYDFYCSWLDRPGLSTEIYFFMGLLGGMRAPQQGAWRILQHAWWADGMLSGASCGTWWVCSLLPCPVSLLKLSWERDRCQDPLLFFWVMDCFPRPQHTAAR